MINTNEMIILNCIVTVILDGDYGEMLYPGDTPPNSPLKNSTRRAFLSHRLRA